MKRPNWIRYTVNSNGQIITKALSTKGQFPSAKSFEQINIPLARREFVQKFKLSENIWTSKIEESRTTRSDEQFSNVTIVAGMWVNATFKSLSFLFLQFCLRNFGLMVVYWVTCCFFFSKVLVNGANKFKGIILFFMNTRKRSQNGAVFVNLWRRNFVL